MELADTEQGSLIAMRLDQDLGSDQSIGGSERASIESKHEVRTFVALIEATLT